MQMFDDWIRLKMWVPQAQHAPQIVALDGKTLATKKEMSEDDLFFQVMEVGPMVKDVGVGNIVAASFMSGDMFRMQLPGEDFKSFATHRGSLIGVVRKQP